MTPTRTKPRAARKPKRQHKKAATPAVTTTVPVSRTPAPALVVPVQVGARRGPSTGGNATLTSVLFIAGVSLAALLFLIAATLPGTPARFTPVGRVMVDHQQDLVLVGLAAFVITIFVYILTGHGL